MKCNARYRVLIPAVIACVGLHALPVAAADSDDRASVLVASIQSNPNGQSYGHWAADWWQWALGIPAATNPLTDTTGAHCGQRQVGDVWFLGGRIFSTDPVVRVCQIPSTTSLFFPLINTGFAAFLNDPPEQRTEAFVRAHSACTEPVEISVWIDGRDVRRPERFFTGASGSQSPFFTIQMPTGNVLGAGEADIPELVLTPTAEQGYYLFVRPLSAGTHTIQWIASGCTSGGFQDITYHLTVAGEREER